MAWFSLPPPVDPSIARVSRELLRSWHFRGWVAFALVLTAILVQLPLFGVVGFELALVVAALGSLAGLVLGVALVRRAQLTHARPVERAAPPPRLVLALVLRAPLAPLAVIAIPLAGAALHGIWAPTCDWTYGLEAFFIMAIASTVLGAGGGAFVALCTGPSLRRLVPAIAAVVLGYIALGLYRFYSEPPVFTYSPLIGFFPGNLYDEDIRLARALYWSRLEQLATLVALVGAVTVFLDAPSLRLRLRARRHRAARAGISVAAPAALLALVLHYYSATLGYAIDAEDIWAELGGVRRTEHFVIHYASDDPDVVAQIDLYAADHEFRLAQVCKRLEVDVARVGTIHSYVFANAEQKGRLMGARRVEMAKPWRREIYVTFEPFPHNSLRHELAHVVAGTFGSPVFHVSAQSFVFINPGMIEGLAVAADWPGNRGSLTPHQHVRAMQELGIAPSAKAVFGLSFLTLSSGRAYQSAGSFMRFLLEQYGAARLRRLYAAGGDFEGIYGVSQDKLVEDWIAMLGDVVVPAADLEAAREMFRQPSVFQRPCPHANAARRRRAAQLPQPQKVRLIRAICKDAPEEPRYRMDLADALAKGSTEEVAEARKLYERFATGESGVSFAAEALSELITLDAEAGDLASVRARLDHVLQLKVDDETLRTFEAMDRALRAEGFRGYFLREYFFGKSDDFALALLTAAVSDDGLGWYLFGLQCVRTKLPALAAVALPLALERGLPSPRFVRNGSRWLAVSAWRADNRAALDVATAALDGSAYETDRMLAADWRERARFTSR
ncbi:MAG TPA: hypothetical protein VM261_03505 [Kofleriaceae bacterium]|nr:hypothetical protein [Kofleriaceae bacterium]